MKTLIKLPRHLLRDSLLASAAATLVALTAPATLDAKKPVKDVVDTTIDVVDKVTGKDKDGGKGNTITVGTPGATTPAKYYFTGDVTLPQKLVVAGPTIIVTDGDFNLGNNVVSVEPGADLALYVKGDLTISGNGHFNNDVTNAPQALLIFGTADPQTGQNITLNGNGLLGAVTYAPYADVTSNGGGNSGALLGSMVANNIRFNGNPGPFHFDEALEELRIFGGYEVDDYRSFRIGEKVPSQAVQTKLNTTSYEQLFARVFAQQQQTP